MAKSKLTPELQKKFCDAIENGDSILGACGYVGIDESTYYKWMKKAEEAKGRSKFVKFKECVDKAKAKALHNFEQVITRASTEHWQAAAWMLERRHPNMYGKRDKIEADVTHKGLSGLADAISASKEKHRREDEAE
ncbi:hypothetical protein [uncultured Methanobrevibacter sp.]|uniref:terminase small subunit-like protein n=1 Tax=uncultured Methanobrevibacter sp. TaxID=253161 RepID=UPI0025F87B5F|nr:hypothetical protein [uncultured Methanobrevibacter sp.]